MNTRTLNKIFQRKKGIAAVPTVLVDVYATVVILFLIILFFILFQFSAKKITIDVAGEQYVYEANELLMLYLQSPVTDEAGNAKKMYELIPQLKDSKTKELFITQTSERLNALIGYPLLGWSVIVKDNNGKEIVYASHFQYEDVVDKPGRWARARRSPITSRASIPVPLENPHEMYEAILSVQ